MRKVKISFSKDKGDVFVKSPYKKGYAVWVLKEMEETNELYAHYSHKWVLYSKKREYSPVRVAKWNEEFLFGANLISTMAKTAAARHRYDLFNTIYTMEICPYLTY